MGREQELLDAARSGHITSVGKILEQISRRSGPLASFRRRPSINTQDTNGYTPLHHACLNGHSEIVRLLLAHEAKIDVPDIRGTTPLFLASWAGQQEIVKMLLMHTHPANPNAQTIDNETPLHCAAQHGHNAVLAILLSYGADPTIRNNSFQTALDLAAQFGRLQVVQILIRTYPELIAPLGMATPQSNKHIFTHTCLHLASRNGHKRVVETLLTAGVDVNILTNAGTALHEAALCGKKSVVIALLHAGVDINATDGCGRTALDILKDYPAHVTYGIVSAINDFCNPNSETHFKPISANENATRKHTDSPSTSNTDDITDNSNTLPKSTAAFEKRHKDAFLARKLFKLNLEPTPKNIVPQGLSSSLTSLEQPIIRRERYVKMEPIMWQKPANSPPQITEPEMTDYKPVYKQPCFASPSKAYNHAANGSEPATINRFLPNTSNGVPTRFPTKNFRRLYLPRSNSASEKHSSSSNRMCVDLGSTPPLTRYRCVDEYVEMSVPRSNTSSPSYSPKKPLPSPRIFRSNDYANINTIFTKSNSLDRRFSSTPFRMLASTDANNNKEHSPTPNFPPPSVAQAEHTILKFMQPLDKKSKRRSLPVQDNRLDIDVESLLLAAMEQESSLESPNSCLSDLIEEFISDVPFGGLFKGSTYNLSNENGNKHDLLERQPSGLRSPSLVKAATPVPPRRRLLPHKNSNTAEEFNETKVWQEINTILESIGNEMLNVENAATKQDKNETLDVQLRFRNADENQIEISVKDTQPREDDTPKETVKIRNPVDLLLGARISKNPTANWCHSVNTLIYGQILYDVYYLGSTVIRELRGMASTRKSIQKLKRGETPIDNEQDTDLLQDCNNYTKFLKANNQDMRLKVVISLSYAGVKFIDFESKSPICSHDIENINCVCQDAEDLQYFAYITREEDIHYCHVFMVDNVDLAKEIILTLGQTFEVAYQLALIKRQTTGKE